jgi:diguanylate cyclase (GGDEF)-like protein
MMDIDHFKVYNDTYGHEAGDLLLTEVAKLIRTRIRGSDIACRYGGEEIVLVIPDVAETTALERAEKLRIEISQLRLPYGDEILEPVTVSIGVSMCPKDGLTPQELLRRADQALYTAKEAGRNRVSL